jgi:hypothetical protein
MEDIILFLMQEGFASDVNGAIKIYDAMSDEWLEDIVERTQLPWETDKMRRASRKWMKERGMPQKRTPEELKIIDRMAERIKNKEGVHAPTNRRGIVTTGQPQSAPKPAKPEPTATPKGKDRTWLDLSTASTQGRTRRRGR